MKDLIVNQSEWIPIGKIPGRKSVAKGEFVREYGNANGEIPDKFSLLLSGHAWHLHTPG